ncbi:Mbov_0396 family ICE element transmembrane protein [Mycoplasmopsis primatum]|uniref:Mbov_0396 family ICE element transmembrane protein n=1 Tax=Mycoplasmopsis primatum TaxID=55604 RepID=UPI0004964278|nr:hypothetical protein [Mycoplasmopsis primatum]
MIENAINSICYAVFALFYYGFVWFPLLLIKYVVKIYQLLAIDLPQYLYFGIRNAGDFKSINLPDMFIRLAIISMIIFVLLFLISGIKMGFQKQNEESPVKIALRNSLTGTAWIVALPLILYALNLIVSMMFNLIFSSAGMSVEKTLFMAWYSPERFPNFTRAEYEAVADNNFIIDKQTYLRMFLNFGDGSLFVIIGVASSIGTLVPLVLGLMVLIQKIFEQFFLFIIAPFVGASSVNDNGARMKKWQEMYVTKSIVIFGFLLSIQVLTLFLTSALNWAMGIDGHFLLRLALSIIVVIGGAMAATSMNSLIVSFVGEGASIKETLSNGVSNVKAIASLGAGVFAAGAVAKKMLKAGSKMTGATKLAGKMKDKFKKTNLGQKLGAKKNLKDLYKSGKISKEEYQSGLSGVNEMFSKNAENITASKAEWNTFNEDTAKKIKSGESSLDMSDLSASDNSLIKKENALGKEIASIERMGINKDNKAYYNKIKKKHSDLTKYIDDKVKNKVGRQVLDKDKKEMLHQFNAKRDSKTKENIAFVNDLFDKKK